MPKAKNPSHTYLKIGLPADTNSEVLRLVGSSDNTDKKLTQTAIVRAAITRGVIAARQNAATVAAIQISALPFRARCIWIDVYLPNSIKSELDEIAKAAGMSRSALVDLLITEFVRTPNSLARLSK